MTVPSGDQKVWLLMNGYYSAQSAYAAFTDEAEADKAVERLGGEIGEWWLDEVVLLDACPAIPQRLSLSTTVRTDEIEPLVSERIEGDWPFSEHKREQCEVRQEVRRGVRSTQPPAIWLYVAGYDHEKVRKVFSERKARIIADFDLLIEAEILKERTS